MKAGDKFKFTDKDGNEFIVENVGEDENNNPKFKRCDTGDVVPAGPGTYEPYDEDAERLKNFKPDLGYKPMMETKDATNRDS